MRVCAECSITHNENYLEEISRSSDEESNEDNNNEWIHRDKFQIAFTERRIDSSWRILLITKKGPRTNVKDPVYGSIDVCDAKSAILASRLYPEQREWWEWLAGWYPDCPPILSKWI